MYLIEQVCLTAKTIIHPQGLQNWMMSESCTQFHWRQIHEMQQNSDCVSGASLSLIPQ